MFKIFPSFSWLFPWFSLGFPRVFPGFSLGFPLLHRPVVPPVGSVLRVAGGQELLEELPRTLRRIEVFVERGRDRGEMFAAFGDWICAQLGLMMVDDGEYN